jgi:hypothetical protein
MVWHKASPSPDHIYPSSFVFLTLPLSPYTTVATTTSTVGLSMGPVLWYSDPTAVDSRRYYAIHRCSQCNRVKNMRDWWTIGEQSTTVCVCVCVCVIFGEEVSNTGNEFSLHSLQALQSNEHLSFACAFLKNTSDVSQCI